jgi:hypothetical protein
VGKGENEGADEKENERDHLRIGDGAVRLGAAAQHGWNISTDIGRAF